MNSIRFLLAGFAGILIASFQVDAQTADSLDLGASGGVHAFALQADGKILVGGSYTTIGGEDRNSIARLNSDGSVDTTFNPNADATVDILTVQTDGRILVGGGFLSIGGQTRYNLARLNPDGSVDSGFNPGANYPVQALALQADGKILIGGDFTAIGGQARSRIARLNADGSLDTGFNPVAGGVNFPTVHSFAVLDDGRMLVGGAFTTLGGQTRNRIARLNPDGSIDLSFDPNVGGSNNSGKVDTILVQADGRILVGGNFTSIGEQPRTRLARLNADGSLDAGFNPDVLGSVNAMAAQVDGKIHIGGYFSIVGGLPRSNLARLNADGSLDTGYDPNPNNNVVSLALQPDGKILVGGYFLTIGGKSRTRIARLNNNTVSASALSVTGTDRIDWLRSGAAPELTQATFELWNGSAWSGLGSATRVSGGWSMTGLTLPAGCQIRAWGRTGSGRCNGNSGFIMETTAPDIAVDETAVVGLASGATSTFDVRAASDPVVKTYKVRNTGQSTLNLGAITVTGVDASEFVLSTAGSTPSVAPGGETTFRVTLDPVVGAGKRALLSIPSDDPDENLFTLDLISAESPVAEIAVMKGTSELADGQSTISFGPVNRGSNKIIYLTIGNTGSAALTGITASFGDGNTSDFLVSYPASTLAPGSTTTFGVTFAPSSSGERSATLRIASNDEDENPFDITLSGTGVNVPEISIQCYQGDLADGINTMYFGCVTLPSSETQAVTVRNVGTADLTGIAASLEGGDVSDFSIISAPASTVAPGEETSFLVKYTPSGTGTHSSNLHIASNDANENPFDITLSGSGWNGPDIVVMDGSENLKSRVSTVNMGNADWRAADAVTKTITISNVGNATLSGLAIRLAGESPGDFTVGALPATTLEPGQKTSFTIAFRPTQGGLRRCMMTIESNDRDENSFDLTIQGAGNYCDLPFNPDADGYVSSIAVQADGKILVGGNFTNIGGQARNYIARLNADGSLDAGFNPDANCPVSTIAVQMDGKILLGGWFTTIGGQIRNHIARLNADGGLDSGFNPSASEGIDVLALQADGKILVNGGNLSTVGGQARYGLVRLNSDGSLDSGFNPNAGNTVRSLAVQADGKILVGGGFTCMAGPTVRNHIARLNADGSLDTGFDPNASGSIYVLALQADGKILAGGDFSTICSQNRKGLARLNTDGTLDAAFAQETVTGVNSFAVQADGRILVGGNFSGNYLVRLNGDGSLDAGFSPCSESSVRAIALQEDGGILVGGSFSSIGGQERNCLARLTNDTPATSVLSTPVGNSRIEWLRGGSAPDVNLVSIESWTGGDWISLGSATRCPGGWKVTGLNLPSTGQIRARGRTGYDSSGLVLETATYTCGPSNIIVEEPDGSKLASGILSAFGGCSIGNTITKTYTVRNSGLSALNIGGIKLTGSNASEFALSTTGTSAPIAPGGQATFRVIFKPGSGGDKHALLNIPSDDPDENIFHLNLAGTGVKVPEIAIMKEQANLTDGKSTLAFGSVKRGSKKTLALTIRNTGTACLTGIKVSFRGGDRSDFAVVLAPASTLGSGKSTTLKLRFTPNAKGIRKSTLLIASNDANENPFEIKLTGTGTSASSKAALRLMDHDTVKNGKVTRITAADGAKRLVITVDKTMVPGAVPLVEVSSDLVHWFSGRKHTKVIVDDDLTLRVSDLAPLSRATKRYIRVRWLE